MTISIVGWQWDINHDNDDGYTMIVVRCNQVDQVVIVFGTVWCWIPSSNSWIAKAMVSPTLLITFLLVIKPRKNQLY